MGVYIPVINMARRAKSQQFLNLFIRPGQTSRLLHVGEFNRHLNFAYRQPFGEINF